MLLKSTEEVRTAETIAQLTYCNPFVPERIALERTLLGAAFVPGARSGTSARPSTAIVPTSRR